MTTIEQDIDPDLQHGRLSTYTNHKCHCAACTNAHRIYQNEYMGRNSHQRHLAVLRGRVRYWRDQVEIRSLRRSVDRAAYRRSGKTISEAKERYQDALAAYEQARAGDRTPE